MVKCPIWEKKMMDKNDYQHFVCIVAGDNPEVLMKDYDKNANKKKHIVFKYKDANKLKKSYIKVYENALKGELNPQQREYIKLTIEDINDMDDTEFYEMIVTENGLEVDEDTGDAYSISNELGKWSTYNLGKIFSIPFLTKDGRETFQARKGDIDWDKIHLNGSEIYVRAWEMVMEAKEPQNDYEQTIYDNMKDKRSYFEKFETKNNYVISNTAFWGYAFLSEKTGWMDASEEPNQFGWMSNFYDVFIKNLPDDTLLTIYECRK